MIACTAPKLSLMIAADCRASLEDQRDARLQHKFQQHEGTDIINKLAPGVPAHSCSSSPADITIGSTL